MGVFYSVNCFLSNLFFKIKLKGLKVPALSSCAPNFSTGVRPPSPLKPPLYVRMYNIYHPHPPQYLKYKEMNPSCQPKTME